MNATACEQFSHLVWHQKYNLWYLCNFLALTSKNLIGLRPGSGISRSGVLDLEVSQVVVVASLAQI